MKKSLILICISWSSILYAQNPPVVEKAAPKSNNLLPSGGTLGSNSGVNPNGNPGTILNGNSNSINNQTAPNPNIEPGVYLNSSPAGTVLTTTINNPVPQRTVTVESTTITPTGGTATSVVTKPITTPVPVEPVVIEKTETNPTVVKKISPAPVAKVNMAPLKDKPLNYTPVLGNYVPEQVIAKIKNKYGSAVYDIRTVRVSPGNKIAYMVRLADKGKFHDELYFDEP